MATILQRISAGDPTAVAACLDEYGGMVWRLALRYLNNRADAEDATQEVFISVWVSAHRFDPARGSEAAFVATIAHRRLTDFKRSAMSRRAVSLERTATPAAEPAAGANGWAAHTDVAAKAFGRLPADERQALWMSIGSGMSHAQIARALEVPAGTVKTRLRRGMLRLRELVSASPTARGSDA